MNSNSQKEGLIDFNLRHIWHKISRLYNQKAKTHGLTMSIGFILLIIDKHGTPSTQIGPRMGMEPTSLSRTLKTMEKRGYIYRKIDEEDKRRVLIFLTPEGLELRKGVRDVVKEFNKELMKTIPQDKLNNFFEVIDLIDNHVDSELLAISNTN